MALWKKVRSEVGVCDKYDGSDNGGAPVERDGAVAGIFWNSVVCAAATTARSAVVACRVRGALGAGGRASTWGKVASSSSGQSGYTCTAGCAGVVARGGIWESAVPGGS
jgi:hypothetical protein